MILFAAALKVNAQEQDSSKNAVDTLMTEDDIRIYINEILISGNKITEPDIILREMETKPEQYTTVGTLKRDWERVYNLGLFTKVDFMPLPATKEAYSLIIEVEEGFYLLPIPIGGIKDGDLKKIWVGLNTKWRNFRGRNETLGFSFGLFYDPFVRLSYSIPWIGKKDHYFSSFDIGYSLNNNKSIEGTSTAAPLNIDSAQSYKTFNWSTGATIGKYLFKELSNSISIGYNSTSTSDYIKDKTLSESGTDNYVSLGYNINYDTRDSYEYTLSGANISANYLKYGFGDIINYNSFGLEMKKFIPIKLSNSYLVSFGTYSNLNIFWGGNIADYHHQQLGYRRIIRGWNDYALEGENSLLYSNELRIPIVQPFYVPGKDLPIAKRLPYLKDISYKFGLYLTMFFDVGGVWNKHDKIRDSQFYNGYGAGLNFILPLGFVGRADWAFRHQYDYFKGQVIFSLNASF